MPTPARRPPQKKRKPPPAGASDGARRIPTDADIAFVEAIRTGTVQLRAHHSTGTAEDVARSGAAFIALALAPVVVRCGQRTWPQDPNNDRRRFTDCFDDEKLCAGCYRTVHPDDQARLFEHAQPLDPAGDEEASAP